MQPRIARRHIDVVINPPLDSSLKPRYLSPTMPTLDALTAEARACTICAAHLPLGPNPIFRVSPTARLLIIGQAPGTKVHLSGIPWNDPSGNRLRQWLNLTKPEFYDTAKIAIMPMGFCYPGRLPTGGDAPPRPECAPTWHDRFLAQMPAIKLKLLIGAYAQTRYLGPGASMTERVKNHATHPGTFALPHPSWRTIGWESKNPWFQAQVLPALRAAVTAL